MKKFVAGAAIVVAVAAAGTGTALSAQPSDAAIEKHSSTNNAVTAESLLSARGISDLPAKEKGKGRFNARYLPTDYRVIDEYDVTLNGFDENNKPVAPSVALVAHVVELATKDREALSAQGESASLVTVVSVNDKNAKVGQRPDPGTKGTRIDSQVHGRPAVLTKPEGAVNSSFVKWTERDGLAVQVNGSNIASDEVLAIAKGLEEAQ